MDNQKTPKSNNSIEHLKNTLYHGDVMKLLNEMPDGCVDMVFADPDYNVNIRYNGNNYTVEFNEYIDWYIGLTKELVRVLKPDGNLFLINYPKQNSYLRVNYLDKVCFEVVDYVWVYNCNIGHSLKKFTNAHRSILHGRLSQDNRFYKDNVALPYQNLNDKRIQKRIENGSSGRMPYSWQYVDLVKNVSKEKTIHACQIPQELSERLIKSCTNPGDLVLIPFGGSGAELEVCRKIDRNFISAEIDPVYCDLIENRLNLNG